jgi:putative ABC transport system permease protein
MKNADLKIDLENILVLKTPPTDINADDRENNRLLNNLKNRVLQFPEMTAVTIGGEIPGQFVSWGTQLKVKNAQEDAAVNTRLVSMDYNYPQFFNIDVIAGRHLRKGDNPWTKADVVINQKLSEQLGFKNPQDAIGAKIEGFYAPLEVRGVLENHHHTSLHADYKPMAYIISGWTEYFFIKLNIDPSEEDKNQKLASLIQLVNKEWDDVFPNYSMDYFFLDQHFNAQYKEDERFGQLFTGFSSLAIVIACLGLFGLTSFTVQQKTKEIGIRKVLGAKISQLLLLLSKEYLILVAVASLLTLPIAWFIMKEWLLEYSFRIAIGWWFFIIPVALILVLAIISISSKIISTARTNPIESLRYE